MSTNYINRTDLNTAIAQHRQGVDRGDAISYMLLLLCDKIYAKCYHMHHYDVDVLADIKSNAILTMWSIIASNKDPRNGDWFNFLTSVVRYSAMELQRDDTKQRERLQSLVNDVAVRRRDEVDTRRRGDDYEYADVMM